MMSVGNVLAERLTNMDWSKIILEISARRGCRVATIARYLNCSAQGLRRLARGDVREPRITLALRLLDMHADAIEGPDDDANM